MKTVMLPLDDVVSLLEWAMKMPGFWQRDDANRLMHGVGLADDECEEHEIAAVGALPRKGDGPDETPFDMPVMVKWDRG